MSIEKESLIYSLKVNLIPSLIATLGSINYVLNRQANKLTDEVLLVLFLGLAALSYLLIKNIFGL